MVRLVHRIAVAYGRLPHEIEALDPYALSMAAVCVSQADRDSTEALRDHAKGAQAVVIVGDLSRG